MSADRIYLDHAATAWPKPDRALAAMDDYARQCGAAAGRGHYASATKATAVVKSLRRAIARAITAPTADSISLHANGTAALNAAIHGSLRDGDHVVTTAAEHNSVLRPLRFLQQHRRVEMTVVRCDRDGVVNAEDVIEMLRDDTRLVAITHANNVTGARQPVETIGEALRDHPARLLCDAAQTFGVLPIDVIAMGIDMLAAPGHKGGAGPLGTGFLYVHPDCQDSIAAPIQGGTGSQSESLDMPEDYPDKMEAGNLNVPALAGWLAGLDDRAPDPTLRLKHHLDLAQRLHTGLREIAGLEVYGRSSDLPIASVSVPGLSPFDLASILDAEYKIETRAGLHCAALIHEFLGSSPDGTLRISAGASTQSAEIDAILGALRSIVIGMGGDLIEGNAE